MSDESEQGDLHDDIPSGRDTVHVALVSGGMDSAVAAAVAANRAPKLDYAAYLDTGTGLDANRDYAVELARSLGLYPLVLPTPESYEEKVEEHGFPGPSRHGMMYTSLKERQISKLSTLVGTEQDLVLWTGVRSDESQRRMAHVSEVQEARRWTWVAPIHDWSKDDCREFLAERDLPRNDLWDTLGRSGDCFCGCFGSPEELLDLRAAGHAEHAEWIEALEERVEIGDETEVWAWGALSDGERRAARAERDDDQMLLCSTCGVDYPAATDGGDD